MNVCVAGLWHLGTVTAACLAEAGHAVTGFDSDDGVVERLRDGVSPVSEPGLEAALKDGLDAARLRFSTDPADSLADADVLWITYDTPLEDDGPASVIDAVTALFPAVPHGAVVLISSQLPVGTTAALEGKLAVERGDRRIGFGCVPENLRIGQAVARFRNADRIVVGLRHDRDRARVEELLTPFTDTIVWMDVESAEMTKHAINAFLATSVAFANELAVLCEAVGADPKLVERGLRSDPRIGDGAYVAPGAAPAGGTLERDIGYLRSMAAARGAADHVLAGVTDAHAAHRSWPLRVLEHRLGSVHGLSIAVWGLTSSAASDVARASAGIDVCTRLADAGAQVRAFDPLVHELPARLASRVSLAKTPIDAVRDASAVVVTTASDDTRAVSADELVDAMRRALIVDPDRLLVATLRIDARLEYEVVGGMRRATS